MGLRHVLIPAALAALACSAEEPPPPSAPPAPQPPDIFVGRLASDETGIRVTELQNATNRLGYDNQPSFTPDGLAVLYTSVRQDGQADIYRYALEDRAIARVTRTAESEYSPVMMAGGERFAVVQVEADSTQRLWQFDLEGNPVSVLVEGVRGVGYHGWADATTATLFVLPADTAGDITLQVADLATGAVDTVATRIGRSLQPVPGRRAVSFVHKVSEREWWIKILDLDTGDILHIARTLEDSEDHAWTPDGMVLMGTGAELYGWNAGAGAWEQIADFSDLGLSDITRLAVHPGGAWIAIVASPST